MLSQVLDVDDDGELDLDELCLAIGADLLAAKDKGITAPACLAQVLESILPNGSQKGAPKQKEAPRAAAVEVQRRERKRGRRLGGATICVGLLTLVAGVLGELCPFYCRYVKGTRSGDFDDLFEIELDGLKVEEIAQLGGLVIAVLGLLGCACPSAAEYICAVFPGYLAWCSPWEVGRPNERIVGLPKLMDYIGGVKETDCKYHWHVQNCKCPLSICSFARIVSLTVSPARAFRPLREAHAAGEGQ